MSPVDFYSKQDRKVNGVFYTPSFLADYLAKKVLMYFGGKTIRSILDPACGDSVLLRSFADKVLARDSKPYPQVYGIDKDINAISASTARFADKVYKTFRTSFIHADGLFPVVGKSSIEGWATLRTQLNSPHGFDIALSNPPWGADLSGYNNFALNANFVLSKGQFDIFDLFVEVILDNLKDNGVYALILPDSIFSQEQTNFRQLLSTRTTIHLIARLGEKIFPEINRACVIIIGKKTKPKSNHLVDCFRLSSAFKKKVILNETSLYLVEKQLSHKVPQSRFYNDDKYLFNIDLKLSSESTFNKIQSNSIPLRQFVINTRGAEISKKGLVCLCPKCNHWMPFPKSSKPKCRNCNAGINLKLVTKDKIILDHNGTGNLKLKVGEDLFRYTSISKSWINTLKHGINYKNLNIYNGDKILVRKTGIGITASIDYDNAVSNQVVYILKLRPAYRSKLSLEFVLGILNSRAMTYYLIKQFGENEWKSHPYLTQTALVNLPFPKIDLDSKSMSELITRTTRIIRNEVSHSKDKNISKATDLLLERSVAYVFKLDQKDYEEIFDTLSSSEQLIPIKRLLNCDTKEIFAVDGF